MKSIFVVFAFLITINNVKAGTNDAGLAYLEENAKKEGVVVTDSGLQYKVLASGGPEGKQPGPSDSCSCHYDGSLIDGTVFDSSRKRGRPAQFAPSGVIKGWTEVSLHDTELMLVLDC